MTMLNEELLNFLQRQPQSSVLQHEPMSCHTSFKIGGPADIIYRPGNTAALGAALQKASELNIPVTILGNGTNMLVRDKGIRGLIIQIGRVFTGWSQQGNILTFASGISLTAAAGVALKLGLTGMEFASGIPGSIGGAVFMNAGAYGGEMKQIVEKVTYMQEDGSQHTLTGPELDFGYRHSVFQGHPWIILEISVLLKSGSPEKIAAQMADLNQRRRDKQPLEMASAGSTFKRPVGNFAGTLIDKAGLKGYTVGDAQVSLKHAGFVVNKGHATCADVLQLIHDVQVKVYAEAGIHLEPEVLLIGEK